MSDQINDAGGKGYCMLKFFIGFFLFVALILKLYWSNFNL